MWLVRGFECAGVRFAQPGRRAGADGNGPERCWASRHPSGLGWGTKRMLVGSVVGGLVVVGFLCRASSLGE